MLNIRLGTIKLVSCALIVLLMFTMFAGPVHAVDLETPISLGVVPAGPEYLEDLEGTEILYDLYKVADAAGVPGYDTYDYAVRAPYNTGANPVSISKEMDADLWQKQAANALLTALAGDTPVVTGWSSLNEGPMRTADDGTALLPGLYLLVVRGAEPGLQDASAYADLSDPAKPKTLVYTEEKIFSFGPALVSLPYTSPVIDGRTANTADGEWFYDVTVHLKPEQAPRFGSIRISKKLLNYGGSKVDFVFTVKAVHKTETVLEKDVTISFSADSEKEQDLIVDRIPAGSEVTVTEKTPSGRYFMVSGPEESQIVNADKTSVFVFINDYEEETPPPPPTGDTTNLKLYIALAAGSGLLLGIAAVIALIRRKRNV